MQNLVFKAEYIDLLNYDRKNEKLFCDVKLEVEGKVFDLHKCILCLRSEYFKALLNVDMKERHGDKVTLQMSEKKAEIMFDYCYTGVVNISTANVLDLLDDAEFLQISCLKCQCEKFVLENVDSENCLKVLTYAQRYNLMDVEFRAEEVIEQNLETIVQSDDINQLNPETLCCLISLENLQKKSEFLFVAIVKWVNHDPKRRREKFSRFFSLLNLSKLSPEFLKHTVANEELVQENQKLLVLASTAESSYKSLTENSFMVIGGKGTQKHCIRFDVETKQKEILPELLSKRISSASVKYWSSVYTFGGAEIKKSKYLKSCETYNIAAQKWSRISDMPECRSLAAATVLKDMVLVTGGKNEKDQIQSSCFLYDVNRDAWIKGSDMRRKRKGHAMVEMDGLLYSLGGWDFNSRLFTCERYEDGRWCRIAHMHEARAGLSAVALNGSIYAIGGITEMESSRTVERYETRMNKWVYVSSMLKPRAHTSACVIKGQIYAIGGRFQAFALVSLERSVEVFDPNKEKWIMCPDLDVHNNFANVVALG